MTLEPSFVKTPSHFGGILPVHIACACCNVKTAMYLLEIYPESINIATADGCYPLHLLIKHMGEDNDETLVLVLLEYLLKHDMGAVYAPDNSGNIALYNACRYGNDSLHFIKPLFDAHPEGIFFEDKHCRICCSCRSSSSIMPRHVVESFEVITY